MSARRRKDSDNENDCENGLRLENEVDNGRKRFSFFTDPLKIDEPTHNGTFAFAPTHKINASAKSKEPF